MFENWKREPIIDKFKRLVWELETQEKKNPALLCLAIPRLLTDNQKPKRIKTDTIIIKFFT